jgi:plasmid stability protein
MATLTIRDLDDELKSLLRVRAAQHGRSMEAEVRAILRETLAGPSSSDRLGDRLHQRFADVGGLEIELPTRRDKPRAPKLAR